MARMRFTGDPHSAGGTRQAAAAGADDWIVRFGRLGYAAHGLVYILVGLLALAGARHADADSPDARGALQTVARQPAGELLLWVIGIGLLAFVLWRLVQAVRDTERKGADARGLALRAGYLVSGLVYLSLALTAIGIARGDPGGGGAGSEDALTAKLMSQPFGRWLVLIAGAIVLGLAVQQFVSAWRARFREQLKLNEMSATEQKWALLAGRWGYAARGVTFLVLGGFLVVAAVQADPQEARGLGEALRALERQRAGPWILGLVGLGLACYGAFQLLLARYRRMLAH